LALANANDQAEMQIITFGNLTDVNTTTYSLSLNDTVFVSAATAGALTNSAPAGEANLIQNIGRVIRADAAAGIIKVGGAGRSNATPNLDDGKIFKGNASNQAESVALSSIALSSLNDDLSYLEPANNLSDVSNASTARTNLGLAIGSDVQAYDAGLADIAGIPTTDGVFIVGNGTNFVAEIGSTARTSLGLGTAAVEDVGTTAGDIVQLDGSARLPAVDGSQLTNLPGGGDLLAANNLSDLANIATARTNLGVAIGSDVQAYDAQLADVAGLTPADGAFIVGDGANFVAESGATARTSLGLGTAATSNTGDFLASTAGLNDLSDVSFTAGPGIDNYVLTYDNASSSWGAEAAAGGGGYSVTVDTTTITTTNPTNLSSPSDNEEVYIISNGATDVTVNMVAAATCGSGFKYTFKVLGTGTITLDPNGSEYIDHSGQTTYSPAQYDSVSLITDGSNWYLV